MRTPPPCPQCQIMKPAMLVMWVRSEFAVFTLFIEEILSRASAALLGNTFVQGISDGGTLENHHRYEALGLQFVDPLWRRNHVVCLGFPPLSDGTDLAAAKTMDSIIKERTGKSTGAIMKSNIADVAGAGVACHLADGEGVIRGLCMMHKTHKVRVGVHGGAGVGLNVSVSIGVSSSVSMGSSVSVGLSVGSSVSSSIGMSE